LSNSGNVILAQNQRETDTQTSR